MVDGLLFFDPYMGYSGLERRWIEASRQFADARVELIERLRDIREDATDAMNEAARDLSVRRSEYDALLQGRARLAQRFEHHQSQIEQTGRALLEIYREANRGTRSTPAPDYFTRPYEHGAHQLYAGNEPDSSARETLRQMIADTQAMLSQQIKAIHEAFDGAVRTYREIDELLPGEEAELKPDDEWLDGVRGNAAGQDLAGRGSAACCCCCWRSSPAGRWPGSISPRPTRPVLDAQTPVPRRRPARGHGRAGRHLRRPAGNHAAGGAGPARRHDHDVAAVLPARHPRAGYRGRPQPVAVLEMQSRRRRGPERMDRQSADRAAALDRGFSQTRRRMP